MQRNTAFAVPFGPGNFRAAKAARTIDPDAFRAKTQRRLNRPLHGPTIGNTAGKLLADILGNQLGVNFRLADFNDIEMHFGGGHLGDGRPQLLDICALLADNHARTGGMDGHTRLFRRTFDDNLANARLFQLLFKIVTNPHVFMQKLGVVVLGVPAGIPRPVDADPEANWIYFLTHYSCSSRSRTTIVMLLKGFRMGLDRPRPRGRIRFITRDLPTCASETYSRSTSS